MTTHTPGPWHAHNIGLGPEGKGPYTYPLGTDPEVAAANARLIARAPAMRDTHQMAYGSAIEAMRFLDKGDLANARTLLEAIAREARAILRAAEQE